MNRLKIFRCCLNNEIMRHTRSNVKCRSNETEEINQGCRKLINCLSKHVMTVESLQFAANEAKEKETLKKAEERVAELQAEIDKL